MSSFRHSLVAVLLAPLACLSGASAADRPEPADDASLLLVRVAEAKKTSVAVDVVLTGDIQAQAQTNVAFRINGKVATRLVEVGDHVKANQVLARLDPQEQRANLDNARAALTSAQALLTQATVAFKRQEQLLAGGYTTRPTFDNAEQQLRTSSAAVESAKAALGTAEEQFSYTELRAGVDGIVLSRSFETGQVVQAGQTVLVLAQDGPRDAVFNVFEALTAAPPTNRQVAITLQSDPSVTTVGTVREIAPSVDPGSGTVRVKIGLDANVRMNLGAVVIGRGRFRPHESVSLPWSALYRWDDKPAVWIYDPANRTVTPRTVTIERYGAEAILLRGGVAEGEPVVTAGIQFLRPGQQVAVAPANGRDSAR